MVWHWCRHQKLEQWPNTWPNLAHAQWKPQQGRSCHWSSIKGGSCPRSSSLTTMVWPWWWSEWQLVLKLNAVACTEILTMANNNPFCKESTGMLSVASQSPFLLLSSSSQEMTPVWRCGSSTSLSCHYNEHLHTPKTRTSAPRLLWNPRILPTLSWMPSPCCHDILEDAFGPETLKKYVDDLPMLSRNSWPCNPSTTTPFWVPVLISL